MKLPIMLRSQHELIVAVLEVNLQLRAEEIDNQAARIRQYEADIKALTLLFEGKKCNDYIPEPTEKKKMADPVFSSRSGWRTRAQMMSDATIPVAKDSAEALKAKVVKEGGIA